MFRLFSMTKGVGSLAAMMAIDRGKLDVDTPVEDILPEFADLQVLDRFEDGKPVMRAPRTKATVRHLAPHSFGFLRNEDDVPGMRAAGSQSWAGVLNTHYWFDPKSDVAAVIMTQSLPFVEPRYTQLYEAYERAVYAA